MVKDVPTLTIDSTMARDYLGAERSRHADAVRLFELHRSGQVELAMAASGNDVDVHFGSHLLPPEITPRSAQIQELVETEKITEAPRLSYPGLIVPGGTYPGVGEPSLHGPWEEIVTTWNGPGRMPGGNDMVHLESHLVDGNDVFVTDDRGLLTMCRRLREEYGLHVEAMTLGECVER